MTDIRPVHWSDAEVYIGHRLDRRRRYAIGPTWNPNKTGEVLLELISCTYNCSGCCELGDYGSGSHLYRWDAKAHCLVGAGCKECGYTGKRRNSYWIDYTSAEVGRTTIAA